MNADQFVQYLQDVTKTQEGYKAKCPAHDDYGTSLSVSERGVDVFLKCNEGCTVEAIKKAIVEPYDPRADILKAEIKDGDFASLLEPNTLEAMLKRCSGALDPIGSGIYLQGEEILLPSGAISIISGATGHGKTSMLINMALNVAQSTGGAHLFSYEEHGDSITQYAFNTYLNEELATNNRQAIHSYFKTDSADCFRSHKRTVAKEGRDQFFKELIGKGKLNIHYESWDVDKLCDAIRFLKQYGEAKVIFMDYIQLLNLPKGRGYTTYSRQEELKQICLALKDVAVETGLPIVLGAQFNRDVKNAGQLHPSRLGEAGDIERIASLIVGMWCGAKEEVDTKTPVEGLGEGQTLLKIFKNRQGKSGVKGLVSWDGNTQKLGGEPVAKKTASAMF